MNPELQRFQRRFDEELGVYLEGASSQALERAARAACEARSQGVEPGDVLLAGLLAAIHRIVPAVLQHNHAAAERACMFLARSGLSHAGESYVAADVPHSGWLEEILEGCLQSGETRERLLLEASRAEQKTEEAEERLRLLDRASVVLTESLDYEDTIARLAELSIGAVADGCIVDVHSKEYCSFKTLAVRHQDPRIAERLAELCRRYPPDPEVSGGPFAVQHSGRSVLHSNLSNGVLREYSRDPDHLEALRELGLQSLIIVPLQTRDHVLGTLTLLCTTSRRSYNSHDLVMAEELARRAATAIEHARLFRESREALEAARQNEEAFRTIAESIPQLVWCTRPNGEPEYFNQRYYDYTGLTPADIGGSKWKRVIHPEDRPRGWRTWRRALQTGEPPEAELRVRARDGSYRWFLGRAMPMLDSQGKITRWIGTSTDIHEQKQLQERLRLSEERYRTLIQQAPIGIEIFAPDGSLRYANPAAYHIWEKTTDDFFGYNILEDTQLREKGFGPTLSRAFRGEAVSVPPLYYDPQESGMSGRRRWVEALFYPVRNSGDLPVEVVLMLRDVTAQREAEQALMESEERFRSLVDSTSQIIWTRSAQGEIDKDQPSWSAFTGQSFEEMRGWGWLDAVHPQDQNETARAWCEAVVTLRPYQNIVRLRRCDGQYRWMQVRAVPVYEGDGSVREWVGTHTDVTDRYAAEEALRASEERFRLVVKCVKEYAIFSLDLTGRIASWNPGAERIFGYPESEAIGLEISALLVPHDRQRGIGDEEMRLAREDDQLPEERWYVRKDGRRFWGSGYMAALRDGAGHLHGYVKIVRDETERKRAEESIRQASEALAIARDHAVEASRAKSAFLANVSHELRTPLNAVIGYSELLKEIAEEEHLEAFLPDIQRISSAGRHLLSLISDILDLSKIEAGKMEVCADEFDVQELLQGIVSTIDPLVDNNNNRFELRIANDLGTMITDETKVRQILINLIGNACKFTDHGVITLDVRRISNTAGGILVFRIIDTGIGMTREQVERIFSEFSQGEITTSRRHGGTGLGLAISRRFARLLGGEITVESEPGKGSTFLLELPAQVASASCSLASRRAGAHPGGPADLRNNTVLVVDHDPLVHELIRKTLSAEGLEVIGALTGRDGLELARTRRPGAILLDVLMPDLDGWSLLATLKTDPVLAPIPVIVLSILEERNLGYALGAADYLTKPVQQDQLLAVLRRYRCDTAPCSILIVDDDEGVRRVLRTCLESLGSMVAEAPGGGEALRQLEKFVPDMIFLDLVMPGMDGLALLEVLKSSPRWHNIPVVIVTGRSLAPEERNQLTGQVEHIIQKNGRTPADLINEVRQLLVR